MYTMEDIIKALVLEVKDLKVQIECDVLKKKKYAESYRNNEEKKKKISAYQKEYRKKKNVNENYHCKLCDVVVRNKYYHDKTTNHRTIVRSQSTDEPLDKSKIILDDFDTGKFYCEVCKAYFTKSKLYIHDKTKAHTRILEINAKKGLEVIF